MKPSQEIARREITKHALRRLAEGGESGRRELFAGSPLKSKEADKVGWQLAILERLQEHMYVQFRPVSDRRTRVYALAPGATVARFLNDERELTRLIWPEDDDANEAPEAESETEAEPAPAAPEVAEHANGVARDAPAPSAEEIAATTLKLVGLIAQKMIQLSERMDALEARSVDTSTVALECLNILNKLL